MRVIKIIILIFFTIFILNGCSAENNASEVDNDYTIWLKNIQEYVIPNITNINMQFDYYEIANGQIVYTQINMDLINVMYYFNTNDPSYINSLYEIDNNYTVQNKALDINETIDAMVFYSYDTFTKVTQRSVYKKGFGIYEYSKNICIVNPNENNCTSYMYISY